MPRPDFHIPPLELNGVIGDQSFQYLMDLHRHVYGDSHNDQGTLDAENVDNVENLKTANTTSTQVFRPDGAGGLQFNEVLDGFTDGSILFSDSEKATEDNANLFWDNTNDRLGIGTNTPAVELDVVGSVQVSTLTAGSVVFAGTDGLISDDNASLFFDDTNNRLGIGTAAPDAPLEIETSATAAIQALTIDQNDADVAFVDFQGTSTANTGSDNNISTEPNGDTSASTVAAPHSAAWTLEEMIRVEVNGTDRWIPAYSAA